MSKNDPVQDRSPFFGLFLPGADGRASFPDRSSGEGGGIGLREKERFRPRLRHRQSLGRQHPGGKAV